MAANPAAGQGLTPDDAREKMNIVIVGHVDHGKSTLVGRLLADTDSLPDGKLEAVRALCKRQGKMFEYAFLLDALEAERDQGITIDSARCFFKTELRDYIIIDAPGHIEFLKNMISGAARAEAALLIIDAHEGVRENSRRHGYVLSMLGISQVTVVVNKMDLVGYDQGVFDAIEAEYREFLRGCGITPNRFVPISAREGDFVAHESDQMPWYHGPTVLEAVDHFEKAPLKRDQPLRLPVQDVYKFNKQGDDRRIVAGRIASGVVKVGDEVVFSPSNKRSHVASIEAFSAPTTDHAAAPRGVGLTLTEQIFVDRGELVSHVGDLPRVSRRFRANIFWLGRKPFVKGKSYKLKLATQSVSCHIHELTKVIDASELDLEMSKDEVGRHDCADLIIETRNPVAFDTIGEFEDTGRFVIVDEYDVAGGGIIREWISDADIDEIIEEARDAFTEIDWITSRVSQSERSARFGHDAALVLLTGDEGTGKQAIAEALERSLFDDGITTYLLDARMIAAARARGVERDELIRRYCEVARLFIEAGHVVISTSNTFALADHAEIITYLEPNPVLAVHLGGMKENADLVIPPTGQTAEQAHHAAVQRVRKELAHRGIVPADRAVH